MNNKSREQKKKRAQSMIEQWKQSGKKLQLYCEEQNLSIHTFRNWLKRESKESKQTKSISDFIPLQIQKSISPEKVSGKIEIVYPNGICIRLREEIDLAVVKYLIVK
jgi:predicted acetyltransferase